MGRAHWEQDLIIVLVVAKVIEALRRRRPSAVRRQALYEVLLVIRSMSPLAINKALFIWIDCQRRDSELRVVVLSLASRHAVATRELDVAPSDSQRNGHVLVIEFRDASGLVAAFIIELVRAFARLTELSADTARFLKHAPVVCFGKTFGSFSFL